ncbi:MAG: rRNA pseudouridine synthase [Clostridia bacterium]|nr:rRNA pseudouridine synthase [Clostridia bacterium]
MRLQKYIALCGVASRRSAEDLISAGKVSVNGTVVTELGTKIDPEKDRVTVGGKVLRSQEKKVYIMLYKPKGYVTTAKDNFDRDKVTDLIPQSLGRLYPVGRLDYDSEGLLLLTNDGDFTFRLTHPSHEVAKSYLVRIIGEISEDAVEQLRKGVVIDGRMTLPAKVSVKKCEEGKSTLLITITEGRNRQVRKMCAAVGHQLLRLCRVAEGPVKLSGLKPGEWRHLTKEEIALLGGTKC